MAAGENSIMSKKIGVCYWSIFNRYSGSEVAEKSPGDSEKDERTKVRDFLKKVKDTEAEIIVYANEYDTPARIEGKEPEFQKEIIKAAMEERMKQDKVPFDKTTVDKPKDIDIEISYKITEHENWENILLDKLKGDGE